jgi:hypothetical protein
MGNTMATEPEKIVVNVKKRVFKVIEVHIPYDQLSMIRVLQKEFNYEVKGTIYVDHDHNFKSFEVRTDNSEIYSYGASDWRISFHTHPDKTAQKYGIRYFSPPSVDDILEIYDHNLKFVPDTTQFGFGELSIIFANEGIYVLQVNRDSFVKFNEEHLPIEGLEEVLNGTFTDFLVTEVKKGIYDTVEGKSINTITENAPLEASAVTASAATITAEVLALGRPEDDRSKPVIKKRAERPHVNFDNPDITVEQYTAVVKRLSRKVSELYGFNMRFHSWPELEKSGLTIKVCDYFLNKKVID